MTFDIDTRPTLPWAISLILSFFFFFFFLATGDEHEFDPENWTSWDLVPPPPTYLQVLTVGDGFAGPITAGEVVLFLVYI
jgi:hypothetical protein